MFIETLALLMSAVNYNNAVQVQNINNYALEDYDVEDTGASLPFAYFSMSYDGFPNSQSGVGVSSIFYNIKYTENGQEYTYRYLSCRLDYYADTNEYEINFIKGQSPCNFITRIDFYNDSSSIHRYFTFDYLYSSADETTFSFPDDASIYISIRYYLYNYDVYNGFLNGHDVYNNNAYQEGYSMGFVEGQNDFINSTAFQDAIDTANESGYNRGYNDGINTQTYTFHQLFGAIADTPIMIMYNLLGFDVFGVSALSIVMTMLTGCIVLFLLKRIVL